MIAFAVCIGSRQTYERYCRPGVVAYADHDSPLAEIETDSIFSGYNEALDAFASYTNLEALVLLHEDVEIRDRDFWEADQTLRREWTELGREMAEDDDMRADTRAFLVVER